MAMMKTVLYRKASESATANGELMNGERITISVNERTGKVIESFYLDFKKSGLALVYRCDWTEWGFDRLLRVRGMEGFKKVEKK